MKISNISAQKSPTFTRALRSDEEKDFKNVTNEAMKALNVDDGVHMFKIFQYALPQKDNENLGIGKINSKEGQDYLDFMALYTGSNAVKIFPAGQFPSTLRFDNYYCPYERCATVVGEDNINFQKLTTKEYGNLLTKEDIEEYTVDNSSCVNYENELNRAIGADFQLIRQAYYHMLINNTEESNKIEKEFLEFKKSQKSDTMDRLAIAPFVKDKDRDLFKDFDNSKEKQERFEEYKKELEVEIDVYKFGKFLALKNLQEAKKELNNKGLEFYGDCPIGFSDDEVFAFPDAFYPENISPGWGFRAINYGDIPKEGTAANKLFKEKIGWHLENFDGIRFDVGWQYFGPKLIKTDEEGNEEKISIDVDDKILKVIEKTAKKIKGSDYDTRKLMYESDAGPDDFQMFDWKDGKPKVKSIMKGRTPVLTSVYENGQGMGWGNPKFFKQAGLKDFMLGTNNHDSTPLRILAEEEFDDKGNEIVELEEIRENNIDALSKNLGIDKKELRDPKVFTNAKFAELYQGKNHFVFFNDVIGSNKRMDKENSDPMNYRYRVNNNTYEKEYHTALQEGRGFNLAESLRMAMKAQALDKVEPELYEKIKKYSAILSAQGAKTKEEAEMQVR